MSSRKPLSYVKPGDLVWAWSPTLKQPVQYCVEDLQKDEVTLRVWPFDRWHDPLPGVDWHPDEVYRGAFSVPRSELASDATPLFDSCEKALDEHKWREGVPGSEFTDLLPFGVYHQGHEVATVLDLEIAHLIIRDLAGRLARVEYQRQCESDHRAEQSEY